MVRFGEDHHGHAAAPGARVSGPEAPKPSLALSDRHLAIVLAVHGQDRDCDTLERRERILTERGDDGRARPAPVPRRMVLEPHPLVRREPLRQIAGLHRGREPRLLPDLVERPSERIARLGSGTRRREPVLPDPPAHPDERVGLLGLHSTGDQRIPAPMGRMVERRDDRRRNEGEAGGLRIERSRERGDPPLLAEAVEPDARGVDVRAGAQEPDRGEGVVGQVLEPGRRAVAGGASRAARVVGHRRDASSREEPGHVREVAVGGQARSLDEHDPRMGAAAGGHVDRALQGRSGGVDRHGQRMRHANGAAAGDEEGGARGGEGDGAERARRGGTAHQGFISAARARSAAARSRIAIPCESGSGAARPSTRRRPQTSAPVES